MSTNTGFYTPGRGETTLFPMSNLTSMPGYDHLTPQQSQYGGQPQSQPSQGGMSSFNMTEPNWGYLQQWAQSPQPVNQLPAWQSMLEAQQRNVDQGAGQLNEFFNTMGGRFSTGYGTAMSDYFSQTKKDQNALLAQMESGALENALGRQYGAAGQLGQFGYGLEAQNRGFGFSADMYNAQSADAAMNALVQNSIYGASALNQNSMNAANNLFNTENQAANTLFSQQSQALPLAIQSQLASQGLNLNTATNAESAFQNNALSGAQLALSQYSTLQDQINRQYQEFIRTSPQYNPWVQMMQQMAMAQQNQYFPQYTPSIFSSLMQGMGGIAAMLKP